MTRKHANTEPFEPDWFTGQSKQGQVIHLSGMRATARPRFLAMIAGRFLSSGKPVLVFSLTRTASALISYLIAEEISVPLRKLKSGLLSRKEWADMALAATHLGNSELHINDAKRIAADDIRKTAASLARKGTSPQLIIIDQFESIKRQGQKRIMTNLINLARDFNIPILVFSQKTPEEAPTSRSGMDSIVAITGLGHTK